MSDRYQDIVNSPLGRQVAGTLGLPVPEELRRYTPGEPVLHGPVLLGGTADGRLLDPVREVLEATDADVRTTVPEGSNGQRFAALVFDASGVADSGDLREVFTFFNATVKALEASGRVLVLATPPEACEEPRERTAQRALEGFVRSAAKEMRGGSTANLVQVEPGAEPNTASTIRFLLSGRSAFVSGQVIPVSTTSEAIAEPEDWDQPLADQVAVVTGAAQGIGAKIAEILARDGAHVICLDIPAQGDKLAEVANQVGGSTLQLDITADEAPTRLIEHLRVRHGGVDIVVHNAGITRDKTLVGMSEGQWDAVLAVNLTSQERINEALLADDSVLKDHARIVCISSLSGIAGNRGQTNYSTSKAGVIGMVDALAPTLDERGGTINGVAPGFIETAMTDAMPIAVREVGRRTNSLNQGGQPVDVAETVAWLANPASGGLNGETIRVCGQSLLGA